MRPSRWKLPSLNNVTVDASRVIFVLYALALTTATHWPALTIGTETYPAPDKIIHMIAFSGLFVLLWRTRWVPRIWQAGLIVLVWALIDELSQSIEVLQRTFSVQDVVAGQLGVVVTLAWYKALAPVHRGRIRYQTFAAVGVIVAGIVLYVLVPGRRSLAWDMHLVLGLAAFALAMAVAVRVYRSTDG